MREREKIDPREGGEKKREMARIKRESTDKEREYR